MRWDESCRVARTVGGREASGVRRIQESCLAVVSEVLGYTQFRQCAQ